MATLAYQRPTHGASILGRVDARAGKPLWVNVTCRALADTTIEIEFKPLDRFTVPCTSEASATRNQINLTRDQELTIQVSPAGDATWSLRTQQ